MSRKELHNSKNFFTSITTFKAIGIIIIIAVIIYMHSLFNGFVGDDDMQILNNPAVHSAANIPLLFLQSTFYKGDLVAGGLYYKPIMSSVFAILYTLFGSHALFFHVFQVLLYIANAVLLFLILRHFFRPLLSLFLALIFLVHPINTENAAYISDLQETLFFFFGSLALFLELQLKSDRRKLFLVSLCLLLSLFSKETGILFIAAVIGYEYFFHRSSVRNILIASSVVIVIYTIFRVFIAHLLFQTDNNIVMQASLYTRLYSAPSVLLYYLKNVFLPLDHAQLQMGLMTPDTVLSFFFALLCVVGFLAVVVWIGKALYQTQRKYFQPYCFFAFLFTIGLLFHSQIFFPLDFIAADRWFYFPFIGLLGMLGIILQSSAKQFRFLPKNILISAGLIIICVLSIVTIYRSFLFYNNLTLLYHDVKLSSDSATLTGDLGYTLLQNGRYQEAQQYLLRAKELDPKNPMVWNELSNYYYLTGHEDDARNAFKKALSYDSTNYQTYQNYAIFSFLYDTSKQTEQISKEGLQKFSTNGVLWQIYALTEYRLGNHSTAIGAAKYAYTYNPNQVTNAIYSRLSHNLPVQIQMQTTDNHKIFTVCPPQCQPTQSQTSVDATFSNTKMNISFTYPNILTITQMSPQSIAIHTLSSATTENALLIYSQPFSGELDKFTVPFPNSSKVQAINPIPLKGFQAQQVNYGDGSVVILLQQKNQAIAMRIPKDSTDLAQGITEIIDSIKVLQ